MSILNGKNKKMSKSKIIVLAPHIDDEVIGCFSVLDEVTDVYYFNECTDERINEAHLARIAGGWNYNMHFGVCELDFTNVSKVYAPSCFDLHKDHRSLNRYAKLKQQDHNYELVFYSIDMNRRPIFLQEKSVKKKAVLDNFSSQKLIQNDDKYHLFEDLHEKDTVEWFKYKTDNFDIKITEQLSNKLIQKIKHLKSKKELSLAIQVELHLVDLIISDSISEVHYKL